MKLVDVKLRDDVREPGSSDMSRFFSAGRGFDLSIEAGVLNIKKGELLRCVPIGNVLDWTPAKK